MRRAESDGCAIEDNISMDPLDRSIEIIEERAREGYTNLRGGGEGDEFAKIEIILGFRFKWERLRRKMQKICN